MDATTMLLERLGSVLRESILLQGARALDLERETSGDAPADVAVPELRLNVCLVSEVFVKILSTGVGALAFIWATVVLLGGFSTYLHKADFWVITVIVFIQAAKVVGLNSKTEAKFCAQVPPVFLELGAEHFMPQGQGRQLAGDAFGKQIISYIMLGLRSARDFVSFMALLASLLLVLPLVAGSSCIALSIFRLIVITRPNYGGNNHADDSNLNVLRALIFFYALVLAQGGLFILWLCLLLHRSSLRDQVCLEYGFQGTEKKKLVDKYIHRTSSACIMTGVLNSINMNLVSFAVDLLQSEYSQDRLSAIQVLHSLTSQDAHKARTLSQVQASPESIAKMLAMLSSKSAIDQEDKVRIAEIVTELASELRLAEIPRALEYISSLIDPCLTKLSTINTAASSEQLSITIIRSDQQGIMHQFNSTKRAERKPLIIHGLLILVKLADNSDNCKEIYRRKVLFCKIMAPITNKLYKVLENEDTAIEITEKSLQVLSKLVSGTTETNRKICKEICSKWLAVKNIHPILTDDHRYNKLKVPAIEILANLVPTSSTREKTMAGFIDVLKSLFFDSDNDNDLRKAAGEALAFLAMNKTYCVMMMSCGTGAIASIVQRLSDMLSDTSNRLYHPAIVQMLMHFCANISAEEARERLAPIKTILHEVLKAICNVEPETRLQPFLPGISMEFLANRLNQVPSQNSGGDGHNHLQALLLCLGASPLANRHSQCPPGFNTMQDQMIGSRSQSHNKAQGMLSLALTHFNRLFNVPGAYYTNMSNRSIRGSSSVQSQLNIVPMQPGRRKSLVVFLGLAVQMCDKLISANDFDAAVSRIPIHEAEFVEKLKGIIESCNKDSVGLLEGKGLSTDYLVMIKSVTKLCSWVMQTKPGYVRYFQEKNVTEKLEATLKTMRDLEITMVLNSNADEMTSYETLSSVMEDARCCIARKDLIVQV
ncbi:unnamed protein product [Urochloa humidicola]